MNLSYKTSTGFGSEYAESILKNKLHIKDSVMPEAMSDMGLMSLSYAFLNDQLIGWCCFQYTNNDFMIKLDNEYMDMSELQFLELIKNEPIMQLQQQPYFLGTLGIFVHPEYRNMWISNTLIKHCKMEILPYLKKCIEIKSKNYQYKFYIDVEPHILKFTERYFKDVCEVVPRR